MKHIEYLMIDKNGYIASNYTIDHIDPEEDYPNILCYTTSQNSFYEVGYELGGSEYFIRYWSVEIKTGRVSLPFVELLVSSTMIMGLLAIRKKKTT